MRVLVTRKAEKQLDKIPDAIAKKIAKDLVGLAENPYPQNSKKLAGKDNYRLRIGVYRAIYSADSHLDSPRSVLFEAGGSIYRVN